EVTPGTRLLCGWVLRNTITNPVKLRGERLGQRCASCQSWIRRKRERELDVRQDRRVPGDAVSAGQPDPALHAAPESSAAVPVQPSNVLQLRPSAQLPKGQRGAPSTDDLGGRLAGRC